MKKLYLVIGLKKSEMELPLIDENNEEIYKLKIKHTFTNYEAHIVDKANNNLAFISYDDNKKFNMSYRVDLKDLGSMIVTKGEGLVKPPIVGKLEDETLTTRGDLYNYKFDITNENGDILGSLNKERVDRKFSYEIIINNDSYKVAIISMIICILNIIDADWAMVATVTTTILTS